MTLVLKINPNRPEVSKIKIAAKLIQDGKLVAFPTETVYGLGVNALNAAAIKKIYKIKQRNLKKGLLLHIADKKDVYKYSREVPKKAEMLMKRYWPGPLTIILKKSNLIPGITTGNRKTVGFRMPDNKIALNLIKFSKTPIAAPSANLSGNPPPTTAKEVIKSFKNKIDCIINGGRTKYKQPSTIIDLSSRKLKILRIGAIHAKQFRSHHS
jgi:L-threonylcarbamoyladenylate synthase